MSKILAIPELSGADKRRFWDKVEKRADGCWVWTGATYSNSNHKLLYGQFRIGAHRYAAHRISWRMFHGAIPDGLQLDHRCHNTLCVNPAHLHVVTQQENSENRLGPNRSKSNGPRSGFRGVTWKNDHHMWCVSVKHLCKHYFGGYYADADEANRAAIALRNKLMTNNLLDR